MAKQLPIKIDEIRSRAVVQSAAIPVNAYDTDFKDEVARYGARTLVRVLHDMLVVREFETMLDNIKLRGEYQGIPYTHLGPAHLSIGQESAAVGQSLALEREDMIFGSHRSHGEILAKSFSCIDKLSDVDLQNIMETYFDGAVYRIIEKHYKADNIKELGINFILYGLLSEIFARGNGINKGLGGSMHAFFVPFGSMPNNAIVGGSASIAVGAALYKKINKKPGIVIANIGDSAMGCGPVWEALTFSSMEQYHSLWEDNRGAPPYMLNVFNNFYGMGGQSQGETMGMEYMARIASGVNKHSMHAERVDGFNPLAVADAVLRKKAILASGEGPVLLDTITYRISGHSPSDTSSYRTKEETEEFVAHDVIKSYAQQLTDHALISKEEIAQLKTSVENKMKRILELVTRTDITPYVDKSTIEPLMFSETTRARVLSHDTDTPKPEVLIPYEENPRVQQLATKKRYAYNSEGALYPGITQYSLRDAIFEAILFHAYHNPELIIYGEENRDWGGAFGCYRGLTESLPNHRLFNSPISEAAIVGTGIGYALSGGSALVELMYCDFLGRAGDEVFNQMPKWQSMSGGILTMPLVVRVSVGNKYGAQHSQDWTAMLSHVPGLMVMYPATPYDAKGMLHYALSHNDPVVFVESQQLYGVGELFHTEGVPAEPYEIPLAEPKVRTQGTDITLITIGPSLYTVMDVATALQNRYHVSAEVIDLRFINPLNYEPLIKSAKKTGKVLLVSTATERGSFMHTVATHITEQVFEYLDAAPVVLGSQNWITPPAELESVFFPNVNSILDTIHQTLIALDGHENTSVQTKIEKVRRNKRGV